MRIYYRGHDALVTDDVIAWHVSPSRSFPLCDLQDVVVVEAGVSPSQRRSTHVAIGSVVLIAAGWPLLDSAAAYAVAIVALTVSGAAGVACWRTRPRRWELRATHRGQLVVLYASSDTRTFNQVTRGLRRAIEGRMPPAAGYELAGG
jgi:hypothetical protein